MGDSKAAPLRPWRDRYLVFGEPCIGEEERAELLACLDSKWLGTGPRVARLEQAFQRYVESPAAVAVSSCTAALHLALHALDLQPGDEVITTALSFCATANAIERAGLRVVFADCQRDSMNLDPAEVRVKIGSRTRAVVPVHFAGRPCAMDEIMDVARQRSLHVVEDCAHAIESTLDGRHCGNFGDFGCFSFYTTKNMTSVEGGMVVCPDPERARRIKTLALQGLSADAWNRYSDEGFVHYEVEEPGFKYNLTDLAASIGIHQLEKLEKRLEVRERLWRFYGSELADLPLFLPAPIAPGQRHAMHLFTCLVDDSRTKLTRDQVVQALHELRIGTGIHYTALHLHPYYRRTYGHRPGDFPNAEFIGARTFSIPFSPDLSDDDASDVVRALRQVLE
jgi:dTDP-4-amino-4,6-dideoxygalactose transaminase